MKCWKEDDELFEAYKVAKIKECEKIRKTNQ